MSTPLFASVTLLFDVSWTHATSSLALYGFCVVYLCLVLVIVGQRTVLTITGARKANEFPPTGEGGSAFTNRLIRAHANMYEAFPFWGLLLLAIATNQTAITDSLALYCLGARIAQVITHLISTSERAVKIRFIFFLTQLGIFGYWLIGFGTLWFS
jgi:uncharacterized MAPEG superfamily protein